MMAVFVLQRAEVNALLFVLYVSHNVPGVPFVRHAKLNFISSLLL